MLKSVTSRGGDRSLEAIASNASALRSIDARKNTNDNNLLAEIGYKQELKRTYSSLQIFGIAYSIMGLLPSIASVTGTGLMSGASGFVWGWFVAGFFILFIGISMSELASSIPTSGGLYYWTFYYAPHSIRVPLSYMIGLSNTLALVGGLCSITYGFAEEILAAVYINMDGDFEITEPRTYGVFAAGIISLMLLTCASSKNASHLQTVSMVCNSGIIVLFFIALPIGTARSKGFNGASFIFGKFENFGTWPVGWEFVQGWLTAIWTIGAFDSCVHMSEEAKNPSKGVPIGIIGSIFACWVTGFCICICTAACMSSDVASVLGTETGFPMAQIIYDSLGKRWAVAFMVLIAICQWLMGGSILTALSRQIWAFARDDGLPFSSVVKVVNKTLKVPLRAVYFASILGLLLGCLTFAGPTAAAALFSLAVAGNYVAWGMPVILRLTSGKSRFHPGVFYLGKYSTAVNWLTMAWIAFVLVMCMFPTDTTVEADTMNYTVVINGGVWILSLVYFYVYKYRDYFGPKSNLDDINAEDLNEESHEDVEHLGLHFQEKQ